MKQTRNNLIFALTLVCLTGHSAELMIFESPTLTAIKHKNVIAGYYAGRSSEPFTSAHSKYIETCEFKFISTERYIDEFKIIGWESALFIPKDPYVTYGLILIDGNTWTVRFEETPRGCRNRVDADRLVVPRDSISDYGKVEQKTGFQTRLIQTIPAIGIRAVNQDRVDIKSTPEPASQTIQKLTRGSFMAALKAKGKFTYVRYVAPKTGEVVYGWTATNALTDPFRKSGNCSSPC